MVLFQAALDCAIDYAQNRSAFGQPIANLQTIQVLLFLFLFSNLEESARILQWIIMASLTYVCFVPAKGLVRDLSANSSNIAFEVPLASNWWQSGLISHKHSQIV